MKITQDTALKYLKMRKDGASVKHALKTVYEHGSIETPPTKAVLKIDRPSPAGCPNCQPHLGTLWLCKKHTPIVSIAHMGFWRYVWCRIVLFFRTDIMLETKMTAQKVLKYILIAVILTQILYLAGHVVLYSIDQTAVTKCNKLVLQSQKGYAGRFFISEEEKAMCDEYQIEINATVGNPYKK